MQDGLELSKPCNLIVYEQDGQAHNAAIDPERMLSIVDNPELADTASEVRRRLPAVIQRVAG